MPAPLNLPKGIVYLIRHRISGKCYVGQTIHTFRQRYSGGRWWDKTTSSQLKIDVKRDGKDRFEVIILAHSLPTQELNRMEALYAQEHNAYEPNGYNSKPCGRYPQLRGRSPLENIGVVTLNNPSGKNIVIRDVATFCEDHGLKKYRIWRILNGTSRIHAGWTNKGDLRKGHIRAKSSTLYHESGTKHSICNLTKFCREKGLKYRAIMILFEGRTHQSQGYALSMKAFQQARKQTVVTLTKGNTEVVLTNALRQAKKVGLDRHSIYRLIHGRTKEVKGWSVKNIREELFGRINSTSDSLQSSTSQESHLISV